MNVQDGHPAAADPEATVPSAPAPLWQNHPGPLSPADATLLLALIDAPGTVAAAAAARAIPAEKLLALIANPAAIQAIELLRSFAAVRRELRADADREAFIAALREVATSTPDLVEKRLAATAGLRALRPSSPPSAGGPRAAASRAVARPQVRRACSPWRGGAEGAFSATASTLLRNFPMHPAHSAFPPPKPEDTASPRSSTQPHQSLIHDAHKAPLSTEPATSPSSERAAPSVEHDSASRGVNDLAATLLAAEEAFEHAEDALLDKELDEKLDEEDAELDRELDADPTGTLAIADHVLAAVESDPDAYPPAAVQAARVYIELSPHDHPPRPP